MNARAQECGRLQCNRGCSSVLDSNVTHAFMCGGTSELAVANEITCECARMGTLCPAQSRRR
eukprot:8755577-Alexandrium_andersonii.AAC.1